MNLSRQMRVRIRGLSLFGTGVENFVDVSSDDSDQDMKTGSWKTCHSDIPDEIRSPCIDNLKVGQIAIIHLSYGTDYSGSLELYFFEQQSGSLGFSQEDFTKSRILYSTSN
jgi:hypothetical protein